MEKNALIPFPPPRAPREMRKHAIEFCEGRCMGKLLANDYHQIMIPATPVDIDPEPLFFTPYPRLWLPAWGESTPIESVRYPEIAYTWVCNRSVVDHFDIDRFRPRSAGGLYGWFNIGVLCHDCNLLKGEKWPWFDYRSPEFKRQVAAYLRKKYGNQLWLWEF